MYETIAILWFPAVVGTTVLLSSRWPIAMRRVSLCFAYAVGATLLCIAVTGLGRSSARGCCGPSVALPWFADLRFGMPSRLPSAVTSLVPVLARWRRRCDPFRSYSCWGSYSSRRSRVIWEPSHVPIDGMSLDRFRVMHYGVCPVLGFALAVGGGSMASGRMCVRGRGIVTSFRLRANESIRRMCTRRPLNLVAR